VLLADAKAWKERPQPPRHKASERGTLPPVGPAPGTRSHPETVGDLNGSSQKAEQRDEPPGWSRRRGINPAARSPFRAD
jgi:hypothetical protein